MSNVRRLLAVGALFITLLLTAPSTSGATGTEVSLDPLSAIRTDVMSESEVAAVICSLDGVCSYEEQWFCITAEDPVWPDDYKWNFCNRVCDDEDPWDCWCELPT